MRAESCWGSRVDPGVVAGRGGGGVGENGRFSSGSGCAGSHGGWLGSSRLNGPTAWISTPQMRLSLSSIWATASCCRQKLDQTRPWRHHHEFWSNWSLRGPCRHVPTHADHITCVSSGTRSFTPHQPSQVLASPRGKNSSYAGSDMP